MYNTKLVEESDDAWSSAVPPPATAAAAASQPAAAVALEHQQHSQCGGVVWLCLQLSHGSYNAVQCNLRGFRKPQQPRVGASQGTNCRGWHHPHAVLARWSRCRITAGVMQLSSMFEGWSAADVLPRQVKHVMLWWA